MYWIFYLHLWTLFLNTVLISRQSKITKENKVFTCRVLLSHSHRSRTDLLQQNAVKWEWEFRCHAGEWITLSWCQIIFSWTLEERSKTVIVNFIKHLLIKREQGCRCEASFFLLHIKMGIHTHIEDTEKLCKKRERETYCCNMKCLLTFVVLLHLCYSFSTSSNKEIIQRLQTLSSLHTTNKLNVTLVSMLFYYNISPCFFQQIQFMLDVKKGAQFNVNILSHAARLRTFVIQMGGKKCGKCSFSKSNLKVI